MKYLLTSKINGWYLLTAVCVFFLSSCRKESEVVDQIATDSFVVNVIGVEEPVDVINKVASTAVRDNFALTSELIDQGGGFYTEAMPLAVSNMESLLDKSAGVLSKTASTAPMGTGKTFVIMLYNLSDNQVVAKQLVKVGTPTVIPVIKNMEYGYVAFSYNDESTGLLDSVSDIYLAGMVLENYGNRDFLFDQGKATAPGLNTPLNITFKHKVSQVDLVVDVSAMDGYTFLPSEFEAFFGYGETPLSRGVFSLLDGEYIAGADYYPEEITFSQVPSSTRYRATFYTTNPISNFTVYITKMNVELSQFETSAGSGVYKLSWVPDGEDKPVNFAYDSNIDGALGKKITAVMYPYMVLPELRILHISGENDPNGYSASPTAMMTSSAHVYDPNAGASYNMLKAEVNFGAKRFSKFKIKGFSHVRAVSSGQVANILNNAATRPDIIILGPGYSMNTVDRDAMVKYTHNMNNGVNANEFGGIPMLWLVSATDYSQYLNFYSSVFGPIFSYVNMSVSSIAPAGSVCGSGWSQGRITNGVFSGPTVGYGDWGAGEQLVRPNANFQQMPSNVYDYVRGFYASVIPQNGPSYSDDGYHMWEGRSYAITYVGDGGFLGNPDAWGSRTETTQYPFATDDQYRPITRGYGYAKTSGSVLPANYLKVMNSLMFGNYIAYASIKARYFGFNKSAHDAAVGQP